MPQPAPTSVKPSIPATKFKFRLLRILSKWQLWAILGLFTSTGVGLIALAVLFKMPAVPNCPAIFWPVASASLRLHCAQIAANKQTIEDLLEAIALVNNLPPDHPLRPEINRLTEDWSQDILRLADEKFHAGKLEAAVAAARKIPKDVAAYKLVDDRVEHWQSLWAKAEDIYQQAEAELRKQNFRQAFMLSVRLLSIGNTYWETTKYQEITAAITSARDDGAKLAKARYLADSGGLTNILEAIKLARKISPTSYAHQAAKKAIAEFSRKLLQLAEATLDRRDLQATLNILDKVPDDVGLKEEAKDFANLARAKAQTWNDSVSGLEEAIAIAQQIGLGRPLYGKAQKLVARWELEIKDVAQLAQAKQLASAGTVSDLQAAISEAALIPSSNPRWGEAQQQIKNWRIRIETIEDRPYLDQADQIASSGDLLSLQSAIEQASQVTQGRALYREAQRRISDWTDKVQRIQDQPFLTRAIELANNGDLTAAINEAQRIRSGRTLHSEAQENIRGWRASIQAQQDMQEARRLANSQLPDDLADAIRLANRVPSRHALRNEAEASITQWSRQLLTAAQAQAPYNPQVAIAIAQKIPSSSDAYPEAQQQIEEWKQRLTLLNPTSPPSRI